MVVAAWFGRLKDGEKFTIAVVLGLSITIGYNVIRDRAHANLLAECSRLSKETIEATGAEFHRKLQLKSDCYDRMNNF